MRKVEVEATVCGHKSGHFRTRASEPVISTQDIWYQWDACVSDEARSHLRRCHLEAAAAEMRALRSSPCHRLEQPSESLS
jgi:hypothetical protein